MARNTRASNGKKKIEPAQLRMEFNVNVPAGGTSMNYIDLSQCASIVNRRFYRQGLNWSVAGFKFLAIAQDPGGNLTTPEASIGIDKLPQTWVMSNAWEKGFRAWQDMNNKAVDETEQQSLKGRFLDFKIYADDNHHSAGFGANLLPNDGMGNGATAGEWLPSEVVVPLTTPAGTSNEFEIIGVGPNYPGFGASGKDAVSLIDGYSNSRALPSVSDPNVPASSDDTDGGTPENWLVGMFNEGTTQDGTVIENLTAYDQPPYPYENDGTAVDTQYPGGANQLPALMQHDLDYITGTTIGGTVYMKGGMFPCGLLQLGIGNRSDTDSLVVTCFVDLVPGHHRGYLCEPMTEM